MLYTVHLNIWVQYINVFIFHVGLTTYLEISYAFWAQIEIKSSNLPFESTPFQKFTKIYSFLTLHLPAITHNSCYTTDQLPIVPAVHTTK